MQVSEGRSLRRMYVFCLRGWLRRLDKGVTQSSVVRGSYEGL